MLHPETCDHCKRTLEGKQSCCAFHFIGTEEKAVIKALQEVVEAVAPYHHYDVAGRPWLATAMSIIRQIERPEAI